MRDVLSRALRFQGLQKGRRDSARLVQELQRQLDQTSALYDFNKLVTTTLDMGEICRRAARAFTEHLKLSRCTISTWEQATNTLTTQIDFPVEPGGATAGRFSETNKGTMNNEQLSPCTLSDECLTVALVNGQETLGAVKLFRDSRGASRSTPTFSPADVEMAQIMASHTAVALHNASLTAEARGRVAQLSTLNRLSTILSLAPSLKEVFDGARREIMSLVEATGMSISLLTPDGDRLDWIYGYEFGQEVDLSNIPPLPITQGFSGHVARARQLLYISQQADQLHRQYRSQVVGANTSAWLGLPMIVANKLIGVLAVENDGGFSDREIDLLKTIVGPLAIAMNNLIQFEEIQAALVAQSQQRLQLQTAAAVAATATSVLELDELMQRSVDLIKERFDLYYVGLFLVSQGTNQAILQAATGEAGRIQIEEAHHLTIGGRSLIGGATYDGAPRITQDVTLDEEWLPNPYLPQTRSELALPLRVRGQIIGALTVQSARANVFTPELISALQTMSDQLAIAIQNAQLLAHAEARAQRQEELNQISARLHRTADVDEIIAIGLRALAERVTGAGVGPVSLRLGRPADEG